MCIVNTRCGAVLGRQRNDVYEFLGVPYAQPPLGDLRFLPAQPVVQWNETIDCTHHKAIAVQNLNETAVGADFEPYRSDFYYGGIPSQTENCLYLDITTSGFSEKKPVYIWLHGGALTTGYCYEPEFDGTMFAQKGVVLVRISHRLNVLGCLALEQLADQSGCSGNYILSDLLCALDWVKQNISDFGGNPDNITVGGQSGGTTKALALAIASRVNGQGIKKLILESGIKWAQAFPSQEEACQKGRLYLRDLGLDENISAEELRALPIDKLMKPSSPYYPGSLVTDNRLLPYDSIRSAIQAGVLRGTQLIIGCNMGEASTPSISTEDELLRFWAENIGCENAKRLRQLTADQTPQDAARLMCTYGLCAPEKENLGRCQGRNLMVARKFSSYLSFLHNDSNVYVYLFNHFTPNRPEEKGGNRDSSIQWAWHSSELWYTFGSLAAGIPPARPWSETDFQLRDQVNDFWTNFIYTGNPNMGPRVPVCRWESSKAFLEIKEGPICHTAPLSSDELLEPYVSDLFRF